MTAHMHHAPAPAPTPEHAGSPAKSCCAHQHHAEPAALPPAHTTHGAEADILALAAGIEQSSEHPLAKAIVAGAATRDVAPRPISGFQSLTGRGVQGQDGGRRISLGNRVLMQEVGAVVDPVEPQVEVLRAAGRPVMYLAADGLTIVMLTGDARATAEAVGKTLHIDLIHAVASNRPLTMKTLPHGTRMPL